MTLYQWVRNEIEKLSFVSRTEFKKASFFIYYQHNDHEKRKILPYRATPAQVIRILDSIKKEIGYKAINGLNLKKIEGETFGQKTMPLYHS